MQQRDLEIARTWFLKSLAISEQQGHLHYAGGTYHQLGRIAEEQGNLETAREWYLKALNLSETRGDLHSAAITCGQLGNVAAKQECLEESGEWLARSIAGLKKTHDQYIMDRKIQNFLIVYGEASRDIQQKLEAIWQEACLGAFPK